MPKAKLVQQEFESLIFDGKSFYVDEDLLRDAISDAVKRHCIDHKVNYSAKERNTRDRSLEIFGWIEADFKVTMRGDGVSLQEADPLSDYRSPDSLNSKNKVVRKKFIAAIWYYFYQLEDDYSYTQAIEMRVLGKKLNEIPKPITQNKISELSRQQKAISDEKAKQDSARDLSDQKQKEVKKEDPSIPLLLNYLRTLGLVCSVAIIACALGLLIGVPRQQTNLILYRFASALVPGQYPGHFTSGIDYETRAHGEIERFQVWLSLQILDIIYDRGSVLAAGQLGSRHRHGYYAEKDRAKALQFLNFAENQGNPLAIGVLANMLSNNEPVDNLKRNEFQRYRDSVALLRRISDVDSSGAVIVKLKHTIESNGSIAAAQNSLGWAYKNGRGLKQDFKKAVLLFEAARKNGTPLASNNLGLMYNGGLGVPMNLAKAIELYREAYELGDEYGLINFARQIEQGNVSSHDAQEAVDLYKTAADDGLAWAITQIARHKELGTYPNEDGAGFMSADLFEAEKGYRRAAAKGDTGAMWYLGQLYESGRLGEINIELAKASYSQIEHGNFNTTYYLTKVGLHYLNSAFIPNRIAKALKVLKRAESLGSAWASYEIGVLYLSDKTIGYSGEDAAAQFRKAMAGNNIAAQYRYGALLLDEQTPPNDKIYGKSLILAAAAQGDPWIMHNAAWTLRRYGDDDDQKKALKLYEKAAGKGFGWSRRQLINYYIGKNDKTSIIKARAQLDKLIAEQRSEILLRFINPGLWKSYLDATSWLKSESNCETYGAIYCLDYPANELAKKLEEIAALGVDDARATLAIYHLLADQCVGFKKQYELLEKSADAGSTAARRRFAYLRLGLSRRVKNGLSMCDINLVRDETLEYLTSALSEGDLHALYTLYIFDWSESDLSYFDQSKWFKNILIKAPFLNEDIWAELAEILRDGRANVESRPYEAEKWYKKAISAGRLDQAKEVARMYLQKFHPVRMNDAIDVINAYLSPDEAVEFLKFLASENTYITLSEAVKMKLLASAKEIESGLE